MRQQAQVQHPKQKASAAPTIHLLQRKCACGNHTVAGGECAECGKSKNDFQRKEGNQGASSTPSSAPRGPVMQTKLTIGATNDPLEQEADRIADRVLAIPAQAGPTRTGLHIQRFAAQATGEMKTAPASVDRALASPGSPLRPALRQDMEQRFGHDFSRVRVHSDRPADQSAQEINADAYTVRQDIVFRAGQFAPETEDGRRLIAHELTHVVQQDGEAAPPLVQRKVVLKGTEMPKKARDAFIASKKWANAKLAGAIIEDMANAADAFDFIDENELSSEVVKRLSTAQHMKESQATVEAVPGDKQSSFGYPFSGQSVLYGPRVNYAARAYWEPAVPDAYAVRTDKKKNKELLGLPRHARCTVYGDQCGEYGWSLTAKGKTDPYNAIVQLFVAQPPHKRTLLHCDYLVSMVNFRSFADSIGAAEFTKRVKAYGVDKIQLRWDAFQTLQASFPKEVTPWPGFKMNISVKGLGSLQRVAPSSEKDFVIGDHVVFFNHLAYDPLNENIGNAWRLENAVLIGKGEKNADIFLGHGSGRKTADELRAKLAEEFNDVAKIALSLVDKTKSKDPKIKAQALADLSIKFPKVRSVGGEWRIQGKSDLCGSKPVDEKLKKITASEVIGPRNPCDSSKMYPVERPIESAK